jgi:hypothetical protein
MHRKRIFQVKDYQPQCQLSDGREQDHEYARQHESYPWR